jgi:hypothetical protein
MPLRRRLPEPAHRALAALCAALVLGLTVLAACPQLHAWLHGEKAVEANDACAVVLFAQGITDPGGAVAALVSALRVLRGEVPAPAISFRGEPDFRLPPGCGPPL